MSSNVADMMDPEKWAVGGPLRSLEGLTRRLLDNHGACSSVARGAQVTRDREGKPVPLPEAHHDLGHIHHIFVAETQAEV